jgi:uncharacterized protein (DUF3084 family)
VSEGLPEGVSRQEFSELASAVQELRDALGELREATTKAEKEEARGEVREARADLAATARELGLDPKRLQAAAEEAKLSDERERLRPLLIELLDEELAIEPEDGDPKAEPKAEPESEPPKEDSAPLLGHWSERPLSSLFGDGK